jgi:hypothetical protein
MWEGDERLKSKARKEIWCMCWNIVILNRLVGIDSPEWAKT